MEFDYRIAGEPEIMKKARALVGQPIRDFARLPERQTKGDIGHAVERYFGIPQNARSEADFPGAGIELKVVPVVETPKGRRVKERTVITMMNYASLIHESWPTAHIRGKLDILFVFHEWLIDRPGDGLIIRVMRWRPRGAVEAIMRFDWERAVQMVRDGRAHELSESHGVILGACTKGPGGGRTRSQPRSVIPAVSRAFALKPSFTLNLLLTTEEDHEGLAERQSLDPLLRQLAPFVGQSVGTIAEHVGLPSSRGKSFAATVVRRLVKEIMGTPVGRLGLTVRTPRVDPNLLPYEAVSFPAFRHAELVQEAWEDSLLLAEIEYMLFLPVAGPTKKTLQSRCTLGSPVYWKPTPEQLVSISSEWEMFRDRIAAGGGGRLPGAASTIAIHVRPHGRNALDVDQLPDGTPVTKKSFWLNRRFIQQLLQNPTS